MTDKKTDKTKKVKQLKRFECDKPCGNCPYLKASPVKHWDRSEFKKLLENEQDIIGVSYGCHKANGNICVGFLLDQLRRDCPSLALRIELSKHLEDTAYLDRVEAGTALEALYENIEAMVAANFPSLLKNYKPRPQRETMEEILSLKFPEKKIL